MLTARQRQSRRRSRNRKPSRRKNVRPKDRLPQLSSAQEQEISQKHRLISQILNDKYPFPNDEPFAASSYFPCQSPEPNCNSDQTCRRVNKIQCKLGNCQTVPTQICESTCAYDCGEHPLKFLADVSTESYTTQTSTTSAMSTKITTPTSTTAYQTTTSATPALTYTTMHLTTSDETNQDKPEFNTTKPTLSPKLSANCNFLPNRGGFQCKNWESPTISQDLKAARSRVDDDLKRYVKSQLPEFDTTLDPDWVKIYNKNVNIFVDETLTTKVFSPCLNFHFDMFNRKKPMPKRKLEAESIIMMVKVRSTCGIPLTQLRKKLMLAALWFFAKHCSRNRNIALAQYIIKLTDDEPTVDPLIEETFIKRALAKILSQASRKWSKDSNVFESLKTSNEIPEHKLHRMNDVISDAIQAAMKDNDTNDLRKIILSVMKTARSNMKMR